MLRTKIDEAVSTLQAKGIETADCGLILGTGLGDLVNHIECIASIPYSEIPHFVTPTVESHAGQLIYGKLGGKKVLAMHGRFHYYEGYSMAEIVFPVYVLKAFGISYLLISNAAGNMNLDWSKGDLMMIDDHINFMPENPLRGPNDDSIGLRFPDMSEPYSKVINSALLDASEELGINLRKGVYVSVQGPNLETRAEYRMLRNMGADAVGMSTVPEVLAAKHIGLPVAAISVLTDDCDPDKLQPANIVEILQIAGAAEKPLSKLIERTIQNLNNGNLS